MSVPCEHLLNDIEVAQFIVNGYRIVKLDVPEELNDTIAAKLEGLENDPGDAITNVVPELWQVLNCQATKGVLESLLGADYELEEHRHWHCRLPKTDHMEWHQDGINDRNIGLARLLGLYYPTNITPDMGPTVIVPGTQYRNAPTDRMKTYTNIRGQVPIVVKAGTIAFTHYDLWHGAAPNQSTHKRHMVKFLFRRVQDNTSPTWNHNPANLGNATDWSSEEDPADLKNFLAFSNPIGVAQSDHYKERAIRQQVWNSLMGAESLKLIDRARG